MNSSRVRNIIFFSIFGLVGILILVMLKPFFFPIFWAAVIAGIFQPIYAFINERLPSPNLATAAVMVSVLIIIILPAFVIGSLLLAESLNIYQSFDKGAVSVDLQVRNMMKTLSGNPYLSMLPVNADTLTNAITDAVKSVVNYIFQSLRDLTQNTVIFVAQFAIMLYTLFFFIRDGRFFLRTLSRLLSMGNEKELMLFQIFSTTARATLKVTLIIGGLQGLLGGLLFLLLGVKGALTWGVVMIFSSIIPGVGCSIVWLPAGITLLIMDQAWKGVTVLIFGGLVISMVDNLLRPLLLGHDVQMHPLLIFLSTLGGIMLFGISGFIMGPIVTSLFLAFVKMYDKFYQEKCTFNTTS